MSIKNVNETIRIRTHDLRVCSTVPQPFVFSMICKKIFVSKQHYRITFITRRRWLCALWEYMFSVVYVKCKFLVYKLIVGILIYKNFQNVCNHSAAIKTSDK
jgi:hypothetical protein